MLRSKKKIQKLFPVPETETERRTYPIGVKLVDLTGKLGVPPDGHRHIGHLLHELRLRVAEAGGHQIWKVRGVRVIAVIGSIGEDWR